MPVNVICPNCKKTLRVPDRLIGLRGKCKFCQQPMLIEVGADAPGDSGLETTELPLAGSVFEQMTLAAPGPSPAAPPGRPAAGASVFEQPTVPGAAPPVAEPPGRPAAGASVFERRTVAGPTGTRSNPFDPPVPAPAAVEPPPLPPRPPGPPKLKIGSLVVSLLSLAVIFGCVAGIIVLRNRADTAEPPAEAPADRYAAIALESGGVRLVIAPIQKPSGGGYTLGDPILRNTEGILVPKNAKELDPAKLGEAMKAVGKFVQICRDNEIPEKNLFVLCNSSVLRDLDAAAQKKAKAALEAGVEGAGGGPLIFVDADDEAKFGTIGCVPPEDRSTAVFLDLGSGSVRCGYHTAGTFTGFDVPLGRKKFAEAVKAQAGPKESFADAAKKMREDRLNKPLREAGSDRKALLTRKKYHLSGGGAWAAAVITHPTEFGEPRGKELRVKLEPVDIDKFDKLVTKPKQNLDDLRKAVLGKLQSLPDADREAAEETVTLVFETFTLEDLIVMAQVLRAISEECKFKSEDKDKDVSKDKDVWFFKDGLYAWPLGFLLIKSGVEK